MTEIFIILSLFIGLIFLFAFQPFWKQGHKTSVLSANQRDEANVTLYHEHKAEIKRDYENGRLDDENYQYLIAELDKSLLQDMAANQKVGEKEVLVKKPLTFYWPAIISVFVIVFAIVVYWKIGAYQQLQQPLPSKQSAHAQLDAEQQLIIRVRKLVEATKQEPENPDNWYALGQALIGAGDFGNALSAFDQVIRIEGVQADLIGAKAQASYYLHKQEITKEVQTLIDQALALDPLESSTNILLGMHHFTQQSYQQAIDYWQLVIDSKYNNVNVEALQGALNEAKKRLGLAEETAHVIEEDLSGPVLTVELSLSEEIFEILSQGSDKVVFVYAIPTDGRRMPLAAVKIKASDLPTTITLSNNNAMTPQANLSSVSKVHLLAVISNSGAVGIQTGDLQGRIADLAVDTTETLSLVIDTVAP